MSTQILDNVRLQMHHNWKWGNKLPSIDNDGVSCAAIIAKGNVREGIEAKT